MFDIGFFELLVIGVVGLLVIGPQQLPGALRTLALWWGRFKRGLQATRSELEQQIGADDIRRQLHNEEVMQRLQATKQEIERTVNENVSEIERNIDPETTAVQSANENASDKTESTPHPPQTGSSS